MQKGETVQFGNYAHGANGEVAPIQWRVLEVNGNQALVVSKYALECLPYNKDFEPTSWQNCTLRAWLNADFYNKAFSDAEKQQIATTDVSADKNPKHDTPQGNSTQDKVFLLSAKQAEELYSGDEDRICFPTPYANKVGV